MIFLGIDPGIERTGFGFVEKTKNVLSILSYGVITTSKEDPFPERLEQLHNDLKTLCAQYTEITAVGVEELFFSKNVKTAMAVSQARGVILFTLQNFHCTIQDIKPVEIKSLVTGNGRASKKEVQRMVQLIFQLDSVPQPDDAADAIAIAIAMSSLFSH